MINDSLSRNGWLNTNYLERLRAWRPDGALLRQFTALSTSNVVAAATSFVSLAVVARVLSVDEFGRLIFARSAIAAVFAVLDPRLEDSLQRFLPIVRRDTGEGAAARLFERALLLDQAVNAAFGGLVLIVLLSGVVPDGGIADSALLVAATAQMVVQGPVGSFAAGYALTGGLAKWGVLQSVSAAALTAGSLAGLEAGGAIGFLTGSAIASFVVTVVLWYATVKRTRRAYGPPSPRSHALPRGFVSFTLKAAANSSILIGAEALPLTIIGLRANAETLGLFRVALSPGRLISAFTSPVSAIIYPRASRASAERRAGAAAAEALRFTRRVAPIAAVTFVLGAIVMPSAITLIFGRSFRDASTTATLLLAAALVRGTVAWSKTLPMAFGDATRRLVVSLVEVTGIITAAFLLAGTRQALGVAIAFLAIAFAVSGYWLNYARAMSVANRSGAT